MAYLTSPASGIGLMTTVAGRCLDVWYPAPSLAADPQPVAELASASRTDALREVEITTISTQIEDLSAPPVDAADVYLRLHLLSSRQIRPHQANLENIFQLLTNCAWTSLGPVLPDDLSALTMRAHAQHTPICVHSIDKFPRMVDYVVPSGVRIADSSRVRLGAYLAEGTTVMHEGFVNFNAGTLGASMVEGRISAGVTVDDGSDIGGGASIMGTLSGGGSEIISIGKRCLIGANAGLGISLGDDCIIEAGLYLTAGTKVTLPDGEVEKARELSRQSGLTFRRNSSNGRVEALARSGQWAGLNSSLHTN